MLGSHTSLEAAAVGWEEVVGVGVCYEVETTGFSVVQIEYGACERKKPRMPQKCWPEPQEVWAGIGPHCCPQGTWSPVEGREAPTPGPQSTRRQMSWEGSWGNGTPGASDGLPLTYLFFPEGPLSPFLLC